MILSTWINRSNRFSKRIILKSSDKLQELEEAFNGHPSHENLDRVKLQARDVTRLYTEKARQRLFFCKQKVFENGERSGKLLAYLAHLDNKPPVVVSLLDSDGNIPTDPPKVAAKLKSFYNTLYTSQSLHSAQDIRDYLQTIQFPHLTADQLKMLEAPITTDDITTALSQLAKSKAPGLTLEFYTVYSNSHSQIESPI